MGHTEAQFTVLEKQGPLDPNLSKVRRANYLLHVSWIPNIEIMVEGLQMDFIGDTGLSNAHIAETQPVLVIFKYSTEQKSAHPEIFFLPITNSGRRRRRKKKKGGG